MEDFALRSELDADAAIALLEDAFSGVACGMALLDEDLNFVLVNESFADIAFGGETASRFSGKVDKIPFENWSLDHFQTPDGLEEVGLKADLRRAITSCEQGMAWKLRDGRQFQASAKRAQIGGYLVSTTEVTPRDTMEAAERARNMLREAVDALDDGIMLFDSDMNLEVFNTRASEFFQRDGNRFEPGQSFEAIWRRLALDGFWVLEDGVDPEDRARLAVKNVRNGAKYREIRLSDGRELLASSHKTDQGGYLLVYRDRTDQARVENLLEDVIENLPVGVAVEDADHRLTHCNDAFSRFYGISGDELKSLSRADRIAQLYDKLEALNDVPCDGFPLSAQRSIMRAHSEQFIPVEMKFRDGRHILAERASTTRGETILVMTDTTSLKEARDMLLDAFQALDEGMVLCDGDMNYVFGNDAWKKMNFEGAEHMIPEVGDSVVENLAALIAMGHYDMGGMSGEEYMQWMMSEMSQHGKRAHVKFANGRHIMGSSHLTSYGGALLFVRDITEQQKLEAELEQQREITHQNEKLSALGELLAGVAHELNNPLSVVFGYSQMLQGKINDPVLSERVDLICQSSERAAKIVRTFLAMARQRPTSMEPCPVNDILETALEVSSYSLKSNGTEVVVDLDGSDPHVTGDFDQLAQVFSNLIVNAGHAVRNKGARGKITVRTRHEGGQVQIDISDNGNGIPKDIQPRIFEPFFTTKDVGEGTGIGLAFSHRIVESHDGTLTVASTVGQGATFTVRLLASEDDSVLLTGPEVEHPSSRSVLVVDDEEGVARLITDLLTEAGYTVTMSTDPTAALKLAEAQQFDAVLSDFKMPQMSGDTFFRALRAVAPENAARTGFITGDAMSTQVTTFFKTSKRPHIEKPIMKDELLSLLTSLIGDSTT
ncbi:PAS-domain containing protein [Ruegeria lacuscaerulensis]|uniref:PAS-domain containing protein n=1 Tax=Ruegeria lacuscaerulensis TaxID=55218 RepID=UPI00147BB19A|nr:PAS-domain containing protein [Ruegeria lacuscaerulensis]